MKNVAPLRDGAPFVGLCLLALLAFTGLLLWPATHGPFLFDDYANLQHLALLGQHPDSSSIGRYLHAFVGNPGRPLGALSFLIDDQAWPSSPSSFKRTNLLLHLLTGTCVFVLARALARLDTRLAHRAAIIALGATAVWLLSPMQLAATMLVVQRMNILAALLTIVGLVGYVGFVRKERIWLALMFLWFMAGLAFLCKENGVLAFAYATALNHTLLRHQLSRQSPAVRVSAHTGTMLPLALVAVAMWLQSRQLLASYQLRDFSLAERLMTEPRVLIEYLARIVVPRLGGQGIFHDEYVPSTSLLDPLTTLPAIVSCLGAIAAGVWLRERNPWIAFAILWFFAGHLLESTFLPLELYFEHRNYLPLFGPALAAAALVAQLSGTGLRMGLAAILLWLSLACLSFGMNARAWGDELRLARVWHVENPRSIRSTQFLARTLAARGRPELARQVLLSAYEQYPDKTELTFQLALLDCTMGRLGAEDIRELQQLALSTAPAQSIDAAVLKLGNLAAAGTCAMTSDQWNRLSDNLLANSAYGRVGTLAGSLHYQKGAMAERRGDLDAAMREYDQAYLYLRDARISQHQAIILWSAGLREDALHYLDISDTTPEPTFKRWMHDIRKQNAQIRLLFDAAKKR